MKTRENSSENYFDNVIKKAVISVYSSVAADIMDKLTAGEAIDAQTQKKYGRVLPHIRAMAVETGFDVRQFMNNRLSGSYDAVRGLEGQLADSRAGDSGKRTRARAAEGPRGAADGEKTVSLNQIATDYKLPAWHKIRAVAEAIVKIKDKSSPLHRYAHANESGTRYRIEDSPEAREAFKAIADELGPRRGAEDKKKL